MRCRGQLQSCRRSIADVLGQSSRRGKDDLATTAGLADPFILKLAEQHLNGHAGRNAAEGARQRFRDAARLLVAVRERAPGVATLEECVRPGNYQHVIAAAKELSGFDPQSREVAIVGMPARLLALLRDAVSMRLEESSMQQTSAEPTSETERQRHLADIKRECELFDNLLSRRWKLDLGNHAKACQLKRWCKASGQVPETNDVVSLFRSTVDEMRRLRARLEASPTPRRDEYNSHAEAVLSVLVTYNRRRASEVADALYDSYVNRPTSRDVRAAGLRTIVPLLNRVNGMEDESPKQGSATPELMLAPGGKNKRPVAIIIPEFVVPSVHLITRTRRQVGIPDPKKGLDLGDGLKRAVPPGVDPQTTNDLLFPRAGSEMTFDVSAAMRRIRDKQRNLERPELLTTTGLRRHLATSAAHMGASGVSLLRHMDHSETTHRRHYVSADPGAGVPSTLTHDQQPTAPTPTFFTLKQLQGVIKFMQYAAQETLAASNAAAANARDQPGPSAPREGSHRSRSPLVAVANPRPEFRYWTPEETAEALALFPGHIDSRRLPTLREVEAVVREGRGVRGRTAAAIRSRINSHFKGEC